MDELCFTEGTPIERPLLPRLLRPLLITWRFQMLLMEIENLPPGLLADIGVQNGDVRGFAWAVANEQAPKPAAGAPERITQIGSDVWARAFLLHMR